MAAAVLLSFLRIMPRCTIRRQYDASGHPAALGSVAMRPPGRYRDRADDNIHDTTARMRQPAYVKP